MTDLSEILADPETQGKFKLLRPVDQAAWAWRANWLTKAHKHQVVPPGDWWTIWLMLAGRGAGKTRNGCRTGGLVGMDRTRHPVARRRSNVL